MVEVDDEKLQAKMAERAALAAAEEKKREREAQEAREGEALMTKLAADMSAFEGGAQDAKHAAPAEQNAREPAFAASASEAGSDDRAGRTENKGGAFSRFLLGLVSIAAVVVIAACAALYCHEPVLKAVHYLRPVYENVCTKLPCPGFVWAQPLAFEAAAELVPGETVDLKRPDVRVTLRNSSAHPQRLPIIEMKLLDPAGDTIVQRILEPAEYGVAAQNAVLPGRIHDGARACGNAASLRGGERRRLARRNAVSQGILCGFRRVASLKRKRRSPSSEQPTDCHA